MMERIVDRSASLLTFLFSMVVSITFSPTIAIILTPSLERKRLISFAVIFFSVSLLFAQQPPTEPPPNNTFTMTTYYPAPFGAYKKLTVSDSVGIGTTNPGEKLSVEGSATADEDVVRVNNQGNFASRIWLRTASQSGYLGIAPSSETDSLIQVGGLPGSLHLGINNTSPIQFWNYDGTNRTVRMTILSSGNVGIGTIPSDVSILHLRKSGSRPRVTLESDMTTQAVGDYEIERGNAQAGDLRRWVSSFRQDGFGGGVDSFTFYYDQQRPGEAGGGRVPVASFPVMALLPNQNASFFGSVGIGIGTTGPNAPLDVFKSDSSAINNPGNPAIRVTATSGANSEFLSLGYDATLNRGYIQAAQAGVAWEDLLLNPKGGNVGIGTTDPQRKLVVQNDTRINQSTALGLYNIDPRDGTDTVLSFRGDTSGAGATTFKELTAIQSKTIIHNNATATSAMSFWTMNGGTLSNRMQIDSNGNIGIGTMVPDDLGYAGGVMAIESPTSGTNANIEIRGNNLGSANPIGRLAFSHKYGAGPNYTQVANIEAIRAGADDSAHLIFKTRATGGNTLVEEVVRITSTGNVGIGNDNPSQKLDVTGNIYASGTVTWGGSDQRLKQNIHPLTDTLQTLEDIHGVSFEWNPLAESLIGRKTGQKDIGLIAQEVQKFYPELVTIIKGKGQEEYLNLDYSRFTAVLLEAVKELKSEIKELHEENKILKQQQKQQQEELIKRIELLERRLFPKKP